MQEIEKEMLAIVNCFWTGKISALRVWKAYVSGIRPKTIDPITQEKFAECTKTTAENVA